jgi:hypothetical protein
MGFDMQSEELPGQAEGPPTRLRVRPGHGFHDTRAMRLVAVIGSGASIGAGMPSVSAITQRVLTGENVLGRGATSTSSPNYRRTTSCGPKWFSRWSVSCAS